MAAKSTVVFGVFILAGLCRLEAADTLGEMTADFRHIPTEEAYMVVVDTGFSGRIAARFEVVKSSEGDLLTRIIMPSTDPMAHLSRSESAVLLRRFRSFDWNLKPNKKVLAGCSFGNAFRITFMARIEDSHREIEGDGMLMPMLGEFFDVVIPKSKESNQSSTAQRP